MLALCASMSSDPEVTLRQGTLSGTFRRSRNGRTMCAFLGISYAKPPVGNLRFKAPQEPDSWSGVRAAKTEGPKCAQMDFVTDDICGEEDCLYINVYTPSVQRKGAGLSVLVWVHGGGFYAGSGNTELYGPDFLLDHDVVLVTFNYRLGVFGFLNLGTEDAPGNYGMKDQVAALRWVQRNISNFGGNPSSVTIFGESAGGASIHYLLLSPLARGLFHRAVVQSGSAYCPWAFQRNAVAEGRALAARLGCKQASTAAMVAGLRSIDASKLAEVELTLRTETKQMTYFLPSVEPTGTKGAFLSEDPRVMLARGDIANIPIMAGCTTHESLMTFGMLTYKGSGNVQAFLNNPKNFMTGLPELKEGSLVYSQTWQKIKQFYEQLEPKDIDNLLVLLKTDVDFTIGVDELVRGVASLRRSPIFYYSFSYDGGLSMLKKLFNIKAKGASHADELGYLFCRDLIAEEIKTASPSDLTTIDRMTKLWINFARTGNPTPDTSLGVIWEPVSAPLHAPELADTRYFDIGTQLTMRNENLSAKRIAFWQNLHNQYKKQRGKL